MFSLNLQLLMFAGCDGFQDQKIYKGLKMFRAFFLFFKTVYQAVILTGN